MTLHHVVPGLTSRPCAQLLNPAATSSKQTAEQAKEAAVSVDPAHTPAQGPKVLRHAEGKQLPETSTAVQTQSNDVAGLQQHIEQITKDNNHLTNENNRLTKENDCLAKDKNRLTKANDRLTNGYNKLEERYNQVKEDNDQIPEEIRRLKKQLAIVDEQSNTAETRKLINHLTTEKDQLKGAREAAIEQLKAQPIIQDMINKLVKEKEELEEKARTTSYTTAERKMQNQQLQEQADNLANEVKMLRKENAELQKGSGKAGQDGPTMDMAKLLKRYYEIEEQFGQMKRDIKQDVKNALAKKEKKIVQQVQEHILQNDKRTQEALMDNVKQVHETLAEGERKMKKDIKQDMKHALAKKEKKIVQQIQEHMTENEKKMQNHVEKQLVETNEYVQKQVEVRLMENEKYLQERLGVNKVKMWAHSQEI